MHCAYTYFNERQISFDRSAEDLDVLFRGMQGVVADEFAYGGVWG